MMRLLTSITTKSRAAAGPLCLLALLALWPVTGSPANGGRTSSYIDPDVETAPAPEKEVELPAFPKAENLIPFFVSATSRNQFLIDGESLTLDTDDLIRYTLIIATPAGARNITYEAMRCSTAEWRLHAIGQADLTWTRSNADKWRRIRESALNRHHAALFKDYFCPVGVVIQDPENVRRALRRGGYPVSGQH